MRHLLSLLILTMIIACNASVPDISEDTLEHGSSEHTESASPELVGKIDKATLLQEPYETWYTKNYTSYSPDENSLEELQKTLNEFQIKAFMGTWCHDSQRETPRLYKILDNSGFDLQNLELVALNHDKKTPDEFEKGLNILRTPTFVFYKDGIEIGRIVETPRESLEEDILKIITGEEYKHSYQE